MYSKKSKIDIILLTFNRKIILKETLKSIWKRTKTPYRLIVVDAGSNDGTVKYLKKLEDGGDIYKFVSMEDNPGLCACYNEAYKYVESEYFVVTQDDLLPPLSDPDWIQDMIALLDRHEDHAAIAMRVCRMINTKFKADKEIGYARRACCAYLRIHKKSLIDLNMPYPFGEKVWADDIEFQKIIHRIGYKCGFASNIWANHIGHSQGDNKGYGTFEKYFGFSLDRNKNKARKPYPKVNDLTNKPI